MKPTNFTQQMKILGMTILGSIFVMLLFSGCASVRVKHDYDSTVNFETYKTYSWLRQRVHETDAPAGKGNMGVSVVREAVDRELAAKGYVKTDDPNPDFKLAFHTNATDKIDVNIYGYGPWRRPFYGRYANVDRYKEGTLILDIVDAAEKRLIWRGWGTSNLSDRSRAAEKISEVVAKMLEKFPPKSE